MIAPGDWPEEPGVRFLIRSVLNQATICGREEDCPDRVFRCRKCGYSSQTELDGCPACGADWKSIDVSHGPGCPKNRLDEAMDTPNGGLVRRCFRILSAKNIGLTITLADITDEEFRVLELIDAERQERIKTGESGAYGLSVVAPLAECQSPKRYNFRIADKPSPWITSV